MVDLSGQYLGRYHLLERLGEGGMAVVYRAYDTNLEREVAIKIIRQGAFPPETLEDVLKRFEREAKALARLSHPNIVKVYDFGEHEGSPYLVMEYLPGGTLKHKLGSPTPWQEVIHLILPVARGLAYAHRHGIIHRDIKPANILIAENNEPMLTDFGIAKIFEGERPPALTVSGMFMGTPEYTAPEQWTGNTSPQSDMYSLGIVIYEMITGRKPYVADTPAAILLKQTSEPLPRPGKFVGGLPEALERILIKALAREPEDRYEDMNAMVCALQDLFPPLPRQLAVPELEQSGGSPQGKIISIKNWLIPVLIFIGLVSAIFVLRYSNPISAALIQPTTTPTAGIRPVGATSNTPSFSSTPDVCAGAADSIARQRFTLEQIIPCLDTLPEVSTFMKNNITYVPEYDFREHGGNEYVPASLVYERGIDDSDGYAILQCYLLEENGWDAVMVGLSIETPVGSNVCGVNTAEGIVTLESAGQMAGPFSSITEMAEHYVSIHWMEKGGSVRTLRASQITQITTDGTSPSVLELPWVSHPY